MGDGGSYYQDFEFNSGVRIVTNQNHWRASADFNVSYGSGFLDADGPAHLPSHTTLDVALSKSFGEKLSVMLTGLNLSDNHYMLDNSNTFGGTHFVNPREISAQVTYRFRY